MGEEPTRGKRVVVRFGWKGYLVVCVNVEIQVHIVALVLWKDSGRPVVLSIILGWCSSLRGYQSLCRLLVN